jgi:hypothetical protein
MLFMTFGGKELLIMSKNSDVFFENFLFRFNEYGCECVEDVIHTAPGAAPDRIFKLQALPDCKHTFAYAAKKGLVRIAPNGTIEEENILGSLIALPNKNQKEFNTFVKNNGFIFPVTTTAYEKFDSRLAYSILDRLRLTVELMTAANEIRKDYRKIFLYTVQLLTASDITIKTDLMETEYRSCHHAYIDLLRNPPVTLSSQHRQEAFDGDTFTVNDTLHGEYNLNIGEYNDIIGGYSTIPGHSDPLFKAVTALYVNHDGTEIERKITDTLFHYFHSVGIITPTNGWVYYGTPQNENLTQPMKDALVEVANYIVAQEINSNLYGIHPVYNAQKMMPSWKVDTLLSAAYFSIFYLNPNIELYRQCANPRCGKYFLVRTTSTRKKYCSTECCNRMTQDTYRKNKRSQTE